MTKLQRDEFLARHAAVLRTTPEALTEQGMIALPCECEALGCPGWYIVNAMLIKSFDLSYLPQQYQDEVRAIAERGVSRAQQKHILP